VFIIKTDDQELNIESLPARVYYIYGESEEWTDLDNNIKL